MLHRWLWIGVFVGAVFTAVFLPTDVHAQTDPMPIEQYWQQLVDARAIVARLETGEEEHHDRILQSITERLDSITAVSLPDGRVIPVQSTFLTQKLSENDPDFAEIGQLLDTILAEQKAWPNPGIPHDANALAQVLSDDAFDYEPEELNPLQKMWQDFTRQTAEIIARFLDRTGLGSTFNLALNIFGAIALAFVIYYALSGLFDDFRASSQLEEDHAEGEFLTADIALKRADELSTGGDYRTAVRYLYLSSLLLLEERGLLRYDRSLTNREYYMSIAHKPDLANVLKNVIEVFDRVWYGFQPISKESYEQYAKQVDTLKHQKGDAP